ncbi:hypothetical protein ACTFIZ_000150 [Dictyostelium cf. discoideum]
MHFKIILKKRQTQNLTGESINEFCQCKKLKFNESFQEIPNQTIDFKLDQLRQEIFQLQQLIKQLLSNCIELNKEEVFRISINRINNKEGYIQGNVELICLGFNSFDRSNCQLFTNGQQD